MDDLTGFQRDLLYVINGADRPSGQDIKEEAEQYYTKYRRKPMALAVG